MFSYIFRESDKTSDGSVPTHGIFLPFTILYWYYFYDFWFVDTHTRNFWLVIKTIVFSFVALIIFAMTVMSIMGLAVLFYRLFTYHKYATSFRNHQIDTTIKEAQDLINKLDARYETYFQER